MANFEGREAHKWRRVVSAGSGARRAWAFLVILFVLSGAVTSTLIACRNGRRSNERGAGRPSESSSAGSAAPPVPSAVAPPPSSGTEPIVVSIDALPSGTKIFIDGVALATNPYEAERPRDGRIHVIRIEAPGYEPQSSSVPFSAPVHMHVELVPVRGPAQPAAQLPTVARPVASPGASAAR
ncbi:MAG: PEGA domain-containing protein [Polyangiaceae bacterium]|jgi:hypothetical protein